MFEGMGLKCVVVNQTHTQKDPIPMCKIPFRVWIANAAARLCGPRGSVTTQAQRVDCSRQTVYEHAQKVEAAVEAQHSGGPAHEEKDREIAALRRDITQLWDWLSHTIELPVAKQQMFAAKGMGMGLSHSQVHDLLAFLLGATACPSRSTIHRWVQAAGKAAGAVLKRLDGGCRGLVLVGCLDEIFFHRRPVLVGIDPQSMVWFLGKKAADHKGSTWWGELRSWTALRYVTCDAGSGLQSGIAHMQQHQRDTDQVAVEKGLDVFHTKKEAHRVLSILWKRVERLWEQAEKASRALNRAQRQGRKLGGLPHSVNKAWKKATLAFQWYEKREAAWKRVEPALDVCRADGQLNDRAWAQAQVAWALSRLPGKEWSKVRGLLTNAESFTFLDRLHDQLGQLSLPEAMRDALVRLWWLRRQRLKKSSKSDNVGCEHLLYLLQLVLCQKLDPNWRESYRQVATVLSQTVRASSAVECMNSILRMHQSRHRTVTQGMLDLKRLYWNCRVFRSGKRKGFCPYQLLGLKLPSYDFCTLLEAEMSTAFTEAKAVAKAKKMAIAA
jgi:hypothetical protein